jgi:hypothetical protein
MQFLGVVYLKAEKLFEKLNNLLDSLRPWTAICYIDVNNLEEKVKNKI